MRLCHPAGEEFCGRCVYISFKPFTSQVPFHHCELSLLTISRLQFRKMTYKLITNYTEQKDSFFRS
jgi:hypothetical protein